MTDVVSSAKRSEMMAGIKGKNTKPEMLVRKNLHRRGFRFRLHRSDLPGKPDIYLPKYKTAVFVHGCFWHGHNCKYFKAPKSNSQFWLDKIEKNQIRDISVSEILKRRGINVVTIWECSTRLDNTQFELLMDGVEKTIRACAT